jgi:hypothetical protein
MLFKKLFFFVFGILFLITALLFSMGVVAHTPEIFGKQAEVQLLFDAKSALYFTGAVISAGISGILFVMAKKLNSPQS